MQVKHLIVIALAGIVLLVGFNMINSSRHESARAATVNNDTPAASTDTAVTVSDNDNNTSATQPVDIASQPLGQQPKAIMDKATTQINEAAQADKERLEQMSSDQ